MPLICSKDRNLVQHTNKSRATNGRDLAWSITFSPMKTIQKQFRKALVLAKLYERNRYGVWLKIKITISLIRVIIKVQEISKYLNNITSNSIENLTAI